MQAATVVTTLAAANHAWAQGAAPPPQPTTTTTATSGGDTTKACVDAYENAQEHRKSEQLLKARKELQTCAAQTCPAMVQTDCTTWLGQVVDSIPSVVFSAQVDSDSVFDVTVLMDGKTIATQLDGKPIEVDPGLHTFVFEHGDRPPIEKKIIVAAREKGQVLSVAWKTPVPTTPALSPTQAEAPVQKERPIPALFYVLGGTTVAGFGTFAVLGLMGESTKSDLQKCSPNCSASEVNKLKTRFLVADIAAGVGAASAAGALVVFLTRPERIKPQTTGISTIGVRPVAEGAALELSGRF